MCRMGHCRAEYIYRVCHDNMLLYRSDLEELATEFRRRSRCVSYPRPGWYRRYRVYRNLCLRILRRRRSRHHQPQPVFLEPHTGDTDCDSIYVCRVVCAVLDHRQDDTHEGVATQRADRTRPLAARRGVWLGSVDRTGRGDSPRPLVQGAGGELPRLSINNIDPGCDA